MLNKLWHGSYHGLDWNRARYATHLDLPFERVALELRRNRPVRLDGRFLADVT